MTGAVKAGGATSRSATTSAVDMVDVNSATPAELDAVEGLRGHGFEIARYREERGRFTDTRQLDEVPGLAGVLTDRQKTRLTV